jgi:hypothetical protein
MGAFQFIDLRLEAAFPHFQLNYHPIWQENEKKHLAQCVRIVRSMAFQTPSLISVPSRWVVFFAGGANFSPGESRRTQRNSWRFTHARFCEDLVKTLVEIRFRAGSVVVLKGKRLKIKNQITKKIGTKTQPDSAFRPSVTTIEEQGILESFARLPQAEREIVRRLLDEFGTQRVAAIRFPVPFGPKSIIERGRFLSPIYKLIRIIRLIFDSAADGVLRSTYLPWIDSITHVRAGEKEEIELRLNSNYESVWRVLKERLDEPAVRLTVEN